MVRLNLDSGRLNSFVHFLAPLAFAFAVVLIGGIGDRSHAIDLADARSKGAVVREALALGRGGDWAAAEVRAQATGDVLVRDIVRWRKLRAGAGTAQEYYDFVARRGDWPGQDFLAEAVLGERPSEVRSGAGALPAAALSRWRAFSALYRARNYDDAERYLDGVGLADMGDPKVWGDRRVRLARRAARNGRANLAYRLAANHGMTPDAGYVYSDNEWVAGWIALRKLGDAPRALGHFQRFEASVETPISLGRGGYWIGRAFAAMGGEDEARVAYARAARHLTSFYGQLAAAEIGLPGDVGLTATELPEATRSPAMRDDTVRMAVIMHYAGQEGLAFQTFSHVSKKVDGGAALGALADLALDLGRPHYAVRVAKNAARKGHILMPAYYPVTELARYTTEVEPAFAMSIARQETELNPIAVSPAGARGLMQIMPATARKVSGWIDEPYSRASLTGDWRYNARLGQRYLATRVGNFGGSYVMAAAAYNAGRGRVDQWVAAYGDPRLPGKDLLDWMEEIPFSETRNYVQRVIEGLYVYRARISGQTGPMTIVEDLSRGRVCIVGTVRSC